MGVFCFILFCFIVMDKLHTEQKALKDTLQPERRRCLPPSYIICQYEGKKKSDFFKNLGRSAEEGIWTKPLPSAHN